MLVALVALGGLMAGEGCRSAPPRPMVVELRFEAIDQPALTGLTLTSGLALATLRGERVLLLGTHAGWPLALTVPSDLVLQPISFFRDDLDLLDHHATVVHDFDGDGLDDLYFVVGAHRGEDRGPNTLLTSGSDFARDRAAERGVSDPFGRGRGGLVVDVDRDGHEELLVQNFRTPMRALSAGSDRVAELFGFAAVDDAANERAFADADVARLGALANGPFVHALLACDFERDGWVDFVARGGPPLQILRNGERGVRSEPRVLPPDAYLPSPAAAVAADFDGDGDEDLYLAYGDDDAPREFDRERRNRLLLWEDDALVDRTVGALMLEGKGVALAAGDLDLDGRTDLLIAQSVRSASSTSLRVFLNRGRGDFVEAGAASSALAALRGRPDGLLLADLDADGDLDLAVLLGAIEHGEPGGGMRVFRNELPARNWVEIELTGTPGHTLYGTRVRLQAGGREFVRTHLPTQVGGSSFALPLHFGLGEAPRIDEVRVEWPDGRATVHRDLPINSRVRLERP